MTNKGTTCQEGRRHVGGIEARNRQQAECRSLAGRALPSWCPPGSHGASTADDGAKSLVTVFDAMAMDSSVRSLASWRAWGGLVVSIDVRGHDHRFWPGWERLITRIGKAYLHPSRPCRKPECHRKVGGSGRETGAWDVSDCRCEQRPPLSQNRDLSTRPASCPKMASDAVQRVSRSRAETKRRRSVVSHVAAPTRRRCHSGFCLICDAATSRRLSEEAYQRSASKRNARHPDSNCCEMPVATSRVTGDGPPSACRAEISHAAPSRPRSEDDRCSRIHLLECSLRSVLMGGRNEVTAGGGGRKAGGWPCSVSLERIAAMGDSPGDV